MHTVICHPQSPHHERQGHEYVLHFASRRHLDAGRPDRHPVRLRRNAARRPRCHGAARRPRWRTAVLREAVELGITHIDTSDAYGPRVTNQLIREALHPYPDDLHIVTKVGATRDSQGGWPPARQPAELRRSVHENLDNLGLDVLDLVNLRLGNAQGPQPGSLAEPFETLVQLQQQGLIRHLGVSNATPEQIVEAQAIAQIVCVQNMYNLAYRQDDELIDKLATEDIAYVPFFPLGGFTPLQPSTLSKVAARVEATPMSVALAWLLHRSPNILLIPGTSSALHLQENAAGTGVSLSAEDVNELDEIGR